MNKMSRHGEQFTCLREREREGETRIFHGRNPTGIRQLHNTILKRSRAPLKRERVCVCMCVFGVT